MKLLSISKPRVRGAKGEKRFFSLSSALLLFLFFLICPTPILAAKPLDVIISEAAWMGDKRSFSHEWIELANNTGSTIPVDNWILKTGDGSINIKLIGLILVNSFYFLERTNEDTVPDVGSDHIYTGVLNNVGTVLELYDDQGNLIDRADGSAGWPAGNNATKQTMARKDAGSWLDSQASGGTPRAKNKFAEPKIEPSRASSAPIETIIQIPKDNSRSQLIYLASGIAIFSGFAIFLLGKKKKKI